MLYLIFLTSLISAWSVFHIYEGDGKRLSPKTTAFLKLFVLMPGKVRQFILNIKNGDYSMPPEGLFVNNDTLKNGFTILDSTYHPPTNTNILVSTYSTMYKSSVIQLLDLDQLKLKKKWVIKNDSLSSDDDNVFFKLSSIFQHPDVVKGNYLVTHDHSYLYKIDLNGRIVWRKRIKIHHSIEKDAEGDLWVCGLRENSNDYPFLLKDRVPEDMIFNIDHNNGKILFQKSIFDILMQNGYQYLLSIGNFEKDLLHLNDIQPALISGKYWEKGDLLISLRNRNTVFLYRPDKNKILWLKTGPWSNQHDCDFMGQDKVLIFGNDVLRARGVYNMINGHNNAYVYDFNTGTTTTPYANFFKSAKITTPTEGRCDILPDGHLLVEETDKGRILIGDSNFVKIIYVQRENNKQIQTLNWCRLVNDDEINLKQ